MLTKVDIYLFFSGDVTLTDVSIRLNSKLLIQLRKLVVESSLYNHTVEQKFNNTKQAYKTEQINIAYISTEIDKYRRSGSL